jgi:hypothetical protein
MRSMMPLSERSRKQVALPDVDGVVKFDRRCFGQPIKLVQCSDAAAQMQTRKGLKRKKACGHVIF